MGWAAVVGVIPWAGWYRETAWWWLVVVKEVEGKE